MMSSRDLPDRIDGRHLGVTTADALAGAENLAEVLRSLANHLPDPDQPIAATFECAPDVLATLRDTGTEPPLPAWRAGLNPMMGIPVRTDDSMPDGTWRMLSREGNVIREGRLKR